VEFVAMDFIAKNGLELVFSNVKEPTWPKMERVST
jgi:hypothetical protein